MGISSSRCYLVEVDELKKKIQELHVGALRKIDDSHKKHVKGGVTCINDERLQLFLHQIENKMLLVAVVGEGSCGKSTLINAFLRDKILTSGIGKVTCFRIFIGHDPNVHKTPCPNFPKGYCNKCPYLVKGIDQRKDIFCRGAKDIASKIAENNKLDEKDQIDLVLYTYIPLFESLDTSTLHFTPYLVDYPGVEDLKDYVQFRIVSAMIYVENYERLLQNEKKIKEHLHCKPEDASKFFTVSHFDKYYTSHADEENPGTEETKAIVARNIELVKREEVFPVCGKWALRAHLAMKYKERDEISCDAVKEACILCKKVQPKSTLSDSIVEKASHILNVSAFEELEKKLKCSIDQTDFQQWNITVYQQCCALLEGPIQAGDNALQIIESKIKSSRKNKREILVKIQTLETMEEAVKKCTLEELELDSHPNLTNFLTKRIHKKIEGRLKSFYTSCIDSVKSGNYTFGQFMGDRNVFIEQDLSIVIMEELNKEAKKHIEAVKSRLREKYNGLARHILGDDPHSTAFDVEVEAQEVNSCFTGEPSEGIKGFVSYKARVKKWWNIGWGIASGVSGFGLPGILVTMGLAVLSTPVLISSAAIVAGLGGSALLIKKGFNSTDQNTELSEDEVKQLCDKTNSGIKNSATTIRQEFEKAVTSTLSEYNESLKAEYDSKWKPKLKEDFDKTVNFLVIMGEEKSELKQALDELKEYCSTLQCLTDESNKPKDEDFIMITD
ncbi:PREDICTED: uncharacterized protein LOC100635202 isoform X1 [Amphimedon queenslandica]|uniref:Dynamin N-terminal domain-containing protein n=1 Tax=Amphimedon queenslandica TaxID=400682 RepID=A0AAN0JJA1_AMPQE|nr:PREDICTED: uncharacterized protein LOC100635202 isoform X1 [Amphimedon queenslandica]|eukprot:XP_019857110.1 PREDICTED: uncharacterized protein LOC100635202 isoform X1 [Amphimedon queenslandica]